MLSWLNDNFATLVIGILLLLFVVGVIRSMLRQKKSGGCSACGGTCAECAGCSACREQKAKA
ncbi:MAG: FeoB-associated Cys-rich membrane protein [Oscillibacter sp.]|nr:FeoB-associated Cys-rich membrane protein [Oscillibacter sp.]